MKRQIANTEPRPIRFKPGTRVIFKGKPNQVGTVELLKGHLRLVQWDNSPEKQFISSHNLNLYKHEKGTAE